MKKGCARWHTISQPWSSPTGGDRLLDVELIHQEVARVISSLFFWFPSWLSEGLSSGLVLSLVAKCYASLFKGLPAASTFLEIPLVSSPVVNNRLKTKVVKRDERKEQSLSNPVSCNFRHKGDEDGYCIKSVGAHVQVGQRQDSCVDDG